jgi:hypothetical protein
VRPPGFDPTSPTSPTAPTPQTPQTGPTPQTPPTGSPTKPTDIPTAPVDPSDTIGFDELKAAFEIASQQIERFGQLSMRKIDNEDKQEMWVAIKRIANDNLRERLADDLAEGRITQQQFDAQLAAGTLRGGPRALDDFVLADRSIGIVAEHYGVSLGELMLNVTLESNENLTIQQMAAGLAESRLTVDSQSMYIVIDDTTVRFGTDGSVALSTGPEAEFVPFELHESNLAYDDVIDGWGQLFEQSEVPPDL